ncbi:hypothetical protein [uncultured Meiothermus sp.]|uniref:helix-turn-helix domain-containing protein n=1 Tax=uncultured Meiothermus sp. TaxID=157471 RepID=UPI00260BED8E|nr:hypothetical protein [uncultured Meiothermus sp.]
MKTLTLSEAARELNISSSWLRALCQQRRIREARQVARGWRPERWLITLEDDHTIHVLPPPRWRSREVRMLQVPSERRRKT